MSNRTRLIVALAACFIASAASAHHVAKSGPPRAPAASAPLVSVSGFVAEITIDNRVTGTTSRVAVLVADDGRRLVLAGPSADRVTAGAAYTLAGRTSGNALFVDSQMMTAATDPRAAQVAASPAVTLTGMLRLGHADNFDGAPSEFFYAIVTDTQQYWVSLATLIDGLENGMAASVSGRIGADGELFTDRIVILEGPTLKPKRFEAKAVTTSYIVLPVKFPTNAVAPFTYNADPFTVASLTTAVFGAAPANSAAAYYAEASYGQQLLSGLVADNGSGGWLLANRAVPATCDINAIATAAETAAAARGYNVASYTGRVYVFTNNVPGCGWSGLAYVGWERSWIKQTTSLLVISHELGHNFGLLHAASLDCGANVVGGSCTSAEYGDPFGMMGNQRPMHFNSAQKAELGWIAPGTVRTHLAGRTTYTLTPLESSGGTTYAVKIPAAANRTYWLEYRQPIGFDSGLSSYPNNGAQFRVASPFESICSGCADDTEFLDMTPATATFTDGTLVAGQSYTDATYGFTVNVVSATPTALTLEVAALGEVARPDFDFSGATDLVWRNTANGQTALWLMNGTLASASAVILSDPTWTVTALGDFDGGGKTDLAWRNSVTGQTALWLMNGTATASAAVVYSDPSWTMVHTGDLDGDGKTDLVWRNGTTGQTAVWLMNGLASSSASVIFASLPWSVTHVGDFDADGKADLVWRNSVTGHTAVWLMNGATSTSAVVIGTDPNWAVTHVGDLNGDGKGDLIWRNGATGQTRVALMNGTAATSTVTLSATAQWRVVHAGDTSGDGKADLVFRNDSTGQTAVWLMNGTAVTSSPTILSDPNFSVVAMGDFNGDGKLDLVWKNSLSGESSVWVMNGTAMTSSATLSMIPAWAPVGFAP